MLLKNYKDYILQYFLNTSQVLGHFHIILSNIKANNMLKFPMKIEIKDLIDIKEVLEALSKLPDYRKIQEKIEYSQRDVLFGVLCSMFAGNSEMIYIYA